MSFGLDTTVVVRLLVGEPVPQAEAARRVLDEHAADPVSISDVVVGETYFALRHHYGVPHASAIRALGALLADRRVRATGASREVLDTMSRAGAEPGLMDRLIHGGYALDGSELLTFDRPAARVAGARLLK